MSGIIVGLDIGTSFIKTVIGELDADNTLEIIGFAKRPSKGLRNGSIVNIEAVVSVIKETIEAAEQMAGVEVFDVYTAIGGSLVESQNSGGDIVVDTSNRLRTLEISDDAKSRAIESSQAVPLPMDKRKLHCIPQEYIVDDLPPCKDPIGVMGKRLKVKVHIVIGSITACANIDQCIRRAGYELNGIWSKTVAESLAVIHDDEFELGSILIDLGAGTTDVMVVIKGSPVYMTSIPVGANLVSNDIAVVNGIPYGAAEKIKVEKGCCWMQEGDPDEEVLLPAVGGRPPVQTTQSELCQIIQPRMIEIFKMTKDAVVHHSNLTRLNGSIILTGGGALMPGVVPLAQQIWGTTSVRIGEISNYRGSDQSYRDSSYATAVGLVIANRNSAPVEKARSRKESEGDASQNKFGEGLKNLFKKFF